jgi:hypothetical protein
MVRRIPQSREAPAIILWWPPPPRSDASSPDEKRRPSQTLRGYGAAATKTQSDVLPAQPGLAVSRRCASLPGRIADWPTADLTTFRHELCYSSSQETVK